MAEQHHHPKPSDSAILPGSLRGGEQRRLAFVLAATVVVTGAEIAGGLLAHSLALLSDALHMLTDVGSIALTYVAVVVACRPAAPEKTYRNWRYEVIAALFNGLAFLPVTAFIFYEAWRRWSRPAEIHPAPMLGFALFGLAANVACALALRRHAAGNVNVRGAWLHVVGDALTTLGVLVAGALLAWRPAWHWIDPLTAAVIGLAVLAWSLGLVRDSLRILLESVPAHLTIGDVRAAIEAVPGVAGLHDLHVWTITSHMYALTAHVTLAEDQPVSQCAELSRRLGTMLDERFDINHVTLQFETAAGEAVCCEHGTRAIARVERDAGD